MDDDEPEDILEALQTRRKQRLAEFKEDDLEEPVTEIPTIRTLSNDESAEDVVYKDASPATGTLNMSIRERMRNRMKNKAAANQLNNTQSGTTRKLRGLRERALPNRFDDFKQSLDSELNPQLQESIATTKEWKRLKMEESRKKGGMASDEMCFRFFTASLDEDDVQSIEEKGEEPQVISPEPATLAINIEDSNLIYNTKPQYVSLQERMFIEGKILHCPSTLPVPKEQKVAKGLEPRNLKDEGFFVGIPPKAPNTTLNKMEHRILAEYKENLSWFNENGDMDNLSDPLRKDITRDLLPEDFEMDPMLQLDWQKAEISTHDARYIDELGYKHYQIDVDISMIRFTHHPLFSKEHILESRLLQLYDHYQSQQSSGTMEQYSYKFQALRASLKQLQAENSTSEKRRSKVMTEENEKRVLTLKLELRELRRKIHSEEHCDRVLLIGILKTWQSLKKIREEQGYINTTSLLKIKKEKSSIEEDQIKWNEEIQESLEEERAAFRNEHKDEILSYEAKLLRWKKYQKIKKRNIQNQNDEGSAENTDIPKVDRPPPPPIFNEEETLANIKQNFLTTRKKPGEPRLVPQLYHTATVTLIDQCPREEQLRRNAIKNVKYYLKVLFNDIEVSRTTPRNISTDFSIQFGEILNVKILQWPESIKLQIFDNSSSNMLAEVFAPLPETVSIPDEDDFYRVEFSSDRVAQFRHAGVGSGVEIQISSTNDESIIPLTSGVLYIQTNWGRDFNGKVLAPALKSENVSSLYTSRHYDALAALGAAGMVDIQRLLSWIGNAKLDPNDPTNADIVNLAKMAQMTHLDNISGPQYFRLDQLEKETEFVTDEELENNKRFRLIQMRNEGVPEFKHFQMIPIDENFVPNDVFEEYEKRLNVEEFGDENEEYSQRKAVATFLAKVRQQVYARSQIARRQVDLEDIVIEEAIPDIGTLGARISQIMEPRRPLKPIRKERRKIGGQNLATVNDVNILINIVRAFNIPVRIEKDTQRTAPTQSTSFSLGANSSQPQQQGNATASTELKSMVRPFIEVMFQGNTLRTAVADGAWPNWNEDILLPFKPPNNDYTVESLQMVKDKLHINLFDEIVIDMLQDERLRETNVHQRIEKRWLGGIEIPFSTIYFNSKVEGFLKVNSPSLLLGYQHYNENIPAGTSQPSQEYTLLQMFITIEPQLQPAPPMPEKFETTEEDTLVHNAQVWLTEMRVKYPKRVYKTMVSDLDGRKVFITRYIHPQKPPQELILDQEIPTPQKMKLLARFVSLIPFISDSVQFPDVCDIWTTSGQFLQLLAGDEEEHAVLLCNYFLWLQQKAYLVLGYGIPEGSTAYVLTDTGTKQILWNPSSGDTYDVQDVHCPLQSIGCLINDTNIYANMQKEEKPSKISFNVNNPKFWKPFFTKAFVYPGLASIQANEPNYYPIDRQYAINLQEKIEELLRDKLMEWRPSNITRFNRHCAQAFKTILINMESKVILSKENLSYQPELKEILNSYHLTGFPLQMSYTAMSSITDRVYSTGIHISEDPKVEFAFAVHVHPYPNNVLALWIYIGRLARKTSL